MSKRIKLEEKLDLIKEFVLVKVDMETEVDWLRITNENPSKILERCEKLSPEISVYGLPKQNGEYPYKIKMKWKKSTRLQIYFNNGSKLFFCVDYDNILTIHDVTDITEALENFEYLNKNLFY
jgi:hypothetical protein